MKLGKFSLKEMVSIFQLVIVMLCIPPYILLTLETPYPFDMNVYYFQVALFGTASVCLLFALSPWFYSSRVHSARQHVFVYNLIVLWLLAVAVIVSAALFSLNYSGEEIMGFGRDIWEDSVLTQYAVAGYFGYAIGGLLVVMDVLLTVKLFFKPKPTAAVP